MPVVPRSSSDDKSSSDNTAGIHKTSVIVGVVFTVLGESAPAPLATPGYEMKAAAVANMTKKFVFLLSLSPRWSTLENDGLGKQLLLLIPIAIPMLSSAI